MIIYVCVENFEQVLQMCDTLFSNIWMLFQLITVHGMFINISNMPFSHVLITDLKQVCLFVPQVTMMFRNANEKHDYLFKQMFLYHTQIRIGCYLTHKQQDTNGCVHSNIATDALGVKNQEMSTHSSDWICILLDQFQSFIVSNIKNDITAWKHDPFL